MRCIVRCSSLSDLPSEKKKKMHFSAFVCFILVFFLVMSMSLFCVVMLGKQLLQW